MRKLVPFMVLALSACGGADGQGKEPPLSWTTMKDGSRVAIGNTDANTNEAKQLVRCWKAGDSFDCLSISGDEWRTARRAHSAALPSSIEPNGHPPGYDCDIGSVGSGYQEHIFGPHGQLTQHVVSTLGVAPDPSWTKDYVERYFEANTITPQTEWFDCRNLMKVVQAGSNAAIASTSLTLAILDGKERPAD